MEEAMTLLAAPLDEERGWVLQSPGVGLLGELAEVGALARPGQAIATLHVLGRRIPLLIPEGIAGHLAELEGEGPQARRLQAVAYGTALVRVLRFVAGEDQQFVAATTPAGEASGLVLCAPQAGRFFRAPEPGAAPYIQAGDTLQAGRSIGLIEVMKTFSPVKYQPGRGLPASATAGTWLVDDGAEVEEGMPLLQLEEGGA